jgi:hypothetical protein
MKHTPPMGIMASFSDVTFKKDGVAVYSTKVTSGGCFGPDQMARKHTLGARGPLVRGTGRSSSGQRTCCGGGPTDPRPLGAGAPPRRAPLAAERALPRLDHHGARGQAHRRSGLA